MDRTVDRHRSNNTRIVLPRHPPAGETGESTRAAASHIKLYYLRPPSLRHDFGDECAHFAWGPDLGLVADSTLASPLYTLVDRCTIQLPNGSWEWYVITCLRFLESVISVSSDYLCIYWYGSSLSVYGTRRRTLVAVSQTISLNYCILY